MNLHDSFAMFAECLVDFNENLERKKAFQSDLCKELINGILLLRATSWSYTLLMSFISFGKRIRVWIWLEDRIIEKSWIRSR